MNDPAGAHDPASLYDQRYYDTYKSASGAPYDREGPWLQLFAGTADRIVKEIGPRTVLDVGCAKGFLVEALRDRGVEAFGVDVSPYAISQVREDVRACCWVGSATAPFPRRYDLIVCIEVLEHLAEADARVAVANLCAGADDILFSSTPDDDEGDDTHVNVRPVEYWAELFARHGFFRDVTYDASFVAPHAGRFRKAAPSVPELVAAYDRALWQRHLDGESDRRRRDGLGEEVRRLEARLAEAAAERERIDERRRAAELERRRAQIEQQRLAQYIALIESTAGWMLLEKLRRLRARIAPPDTPRARLVRGLSSTVKRALRGGRAAAGRGRRGPRERRVLIVSGSGDDMERYRCHNACEQLRLQGVDAEVCVISDAAVPELAAEFGIVVLHRTAYSETVERVLQAAREREAIVLLDMDDLVFDPAVLPRIDALRWMDAADRALFADGVYRLRETLERCDGALVTTEELAEAVRRFDKPAWVHRNGLGIELLELSERARRTRSPRERVVLGYASGTRTHNRDFEEVTPALERILDAHPHVELWLLGRLDVDGRWTRWGDRVRRVPHVPWRELPALLARVDVSLAPLEPGNPFCECKSELKYLEAAAVGVPTVASDVGAFRHAIRHGDNGFLAADTAGWLEALERLVTDAGLRRAMGERAHADVMNRYHPAACGVQLLRTLEAVRTHFKGETPPATIAAASGTKPAMVFKEDTLAHALLDSLRGLEIGAAAHNPFGLDTRNVALPAGWDFYAASQASDMGVVPARVDIWAAADNIPVGDASQDFVISSHVVEHMPDLIGAFVEWNRVVRDGGYVYMIVPFKGALAEDATRPLTPLEHFVDDYQRAVHTRRPAVRWAWRQVHRLDGWLQQRSHAGSVARPVYARLRASLLHGPVGLATVLEQRQPWDVHSTDGVPGGRHGHYHTFTADSLLALVAWMREVGLCDWELVSREDPDGKVGNGFTLAFRVRRPSSRRRPGG